MDRRSGSERKVTRTAAGSSGDRITALPLELRAQIASLLSFDETVRLTVLSSRAWRHIHLHTRVVKINLVDEDKILGVRVALGRRTLELSSSKVDTLRLVSNIDNHRMTRHAARIIALADPRVIDFHSTALFRSDNAWSLDLPPAARDLKVHTWSQALTIAGPGAAALRKLRLDHAVLRDWPHLPSLVSMHLNDVTMEAPFAPGAWCPLLKKLNLESCEIKQAHLDIRLPRLMFLYMDTVYFASPIEAGFYYPLSKKKLAPHGIITIDAPELIEFEIYSKRVGATTDYKSFTLRAPRLVFFEWSNQDAERMVIDVGRPSSVRLGEITFSWSIYSGEMMYYSVRKQMMGMLQGLLPNIPPENLDDVAKPYLTLEDYWSDVFDDDHNEPNKQQLTCDLQGLIMSHGI